MFKESVCVGDANFSTLPIVKALQEHGYHVICVGNVPTDPCHSVADQSFVMDYANKDALKALIQELKPDYLVSGCNDVSYTSMSWVAEKLGYRGFDNFKTTREIHEKSLFRKLCNEYDYPSPKCAFTAEDTHRLKLPVLLKPTSSFSGKGIELINTAEHLFCILERVDFDDGYIIEEFVEGKLFSHSAFIKDGEILIDFFVNEYCSVYPYQVNSSHLSSDLSEEVKQKARDWLKQFSKDLALVDGLVHTQFLSDGDSFSVLEVCRRCPGDLYSLLIQKSTDAEYAWLFASGFMQQLPSTLELPQSVRYITRHTVSIDYNCVYLGSRLTLDCLDSVNYQLKKCGEPLNAAPYDKAGIYFIEHSSSERMQQITEGMRYFVDIESIATRKSL